MQLAPDLKGARNIHVLTKYTSLGASSRYRSYQYEPLLSRAGLNLVFSALFDDRYLQRKYAGQSVKALSLLRILLRRTRTVLRMPAGACVVLEYEAVPYFPAWLERWLVWRKCKLIVDYDDAIFHQYDLNRRAIVKNLLGNKIATVMRLATVVVAGNPYIASYARTAGAQRVEMIPTVVDTDRYSPRPLDRRGRPFTIGWIGSPTTAPYLKLIEQVLKQFCHERGAVLRLIGAGLLKLDGVPCEFVQWSEASEVTEIQQFDVGVMPLPDDPWARGKCGLKLIQYMACAVPVIASPVGVNVDIVNHGVNGYLAETPGEWLNALNHCFDALDQGRAMGANGYCSVEQRYSLRYGAQQWVKLLGSV